LKIQEKLALGGQVAKRLRHTSRDPAEWIALLRDGRTIYILSSKTSLMISTGKDLNEALRKHMSQEYERVLHKHGTRAVTTEAMLEKTGLNLGAGVVVNGKVLGDVY